VGFNDSSTWPYDSRIVSFIGCVIFIKMIWMVYLLLWPNIMWILLDM
jgi:hypothetical protein